MKKRIIGIILTLALVAALLPASIVAAGGIDTSDWTLLTGSTGGMTVGASGATGYYRVQSNTSFTNSTVGGSGLSIADGATVYLYIPENVTLTCKGADGENAVGGGAGIELPENATLYLLGEGTLNALGGSAGNGGDGNDADASVILDVNGGIVTYGFHWNDSLFSGNGGNGGAGGGGAGAGIGTEGAPGGNGGAGGEGVHSKSLARTSTATSTGVYNGNDGLSGEASKAADQMGTLHISDTVTVNAVGGSAGTGGMQGAVGNSMITAASTGSDAWGFQFGASGGGGGGGGGYAAANIGQGGASGAGGGGGGSGSVGYLGYNGHLDVWEPATGNAAGGTGGVGGSNGENGGGTQTTAHGKDVNAAVTGGVGGMSGEAGENGAPKRYDYRSFYRTDNIAENNGTTFNVLATAATGSSGGYADITYYVTIEWSADAAGIEFENGALYEWSAEELKYVPVEGEIIQLLGESVCLNMTITVTNRSNAAAEYAVSYADSDDSLTTAEAKKEDSENDASGTLASADQNGAAAAAPGSGHAYAITAELIDAGENVAPSAVYTGVISVTEVTDDTIFEEGTDLTLGVYTVTLSAE